MQRRLAPQVALLRAQPHAQVVDPELGPVRQPRREPLRELRDGDELRQGCGGDDDRLAVAHGPGGARLRQLAVPQQPAVADPVRVKGALLAGVPTLHVRAGVRDAVDAARPEDHPAVGEGEGVLPPRRRVPDPAAVEEPVAVEAAVDVHVEEGVVAREHRHEIPDEALAVVVPKPAPISGVHGDDALVAPASPGMKHGVDDDASVGLHVGRVAPHALLAALVPDGLPGPHAEGEHVAVPRVPVELAVHQRRARVDERCRRPPIPELDPCWAELVHARLGREVEVELIVDERPPDHNGVVPAAGMVPAPAKGLGEVCRRPQHGGRVLRGAQGEGPIGPLGQLRVLRLPVQEHSGGAPKAGRHKTQPRKAHGGRCRRLRTDGWYSRRAASTA
mmetsp:Transcript_42650/g.132107  ORF Transcript_42650/g.132107 Transcript_42650/m.132107 type:complete len:390 (+) Transcript_42650:490-1659(+)